MIPYLSLSPLNLSGSSVLSLGKNHNVGQPGIQTPSTSLTVPSTLASTILGFTEMAFAAAQKSGAICLQCPHHGAQNLTRYYFQSPKTISLKFFPTNSLTNSSLSQGIGADLKNLFAYPLLTFYTNQQRPCLVTSFDGYTYVFEPYQINNMIGVEYTSIPKNGANLVK